MKEIEAKVRLDDKTLFEKAGLTLKQSVHVFDTFFDTPDRELKRDDRVLRLRQENDKVLLAYKGPRDNDAALTVRDEFEMHVESFEMMQKVLTGLGYTAVSNAEKERSYFAHPTLKSLSITSDYYPFIGLFMEIEGDEEEVISALGEFGYSMKDVLRKNCAELFEQFYAEHPLPFENPELHFTFQDEQTYHHSL